MTHPKLFTIVTINFNNALELRRTISSVSQQTYRDLEYIVIDGLSSDLSVEVIQGAGSKIDFWISERDGGIYDAMNKGVGKATGEYIIFMNSGDTFFRPDVLEKIAGFIKVSKPDLVYGDHEVSYASGFKRIQHAKSVTCLWKGMICSHQALLVKTAILRQHRFDLSYRLNADYAFIYEAYKRGFTFSRMPNLVIASITAGGRSDVDRVTSILSRLQVISKFERVAWRSLYYRFLLWDAKIRLFCKRLLPSKAVQWIIRIKYQTRLFS